jgi:hypothetical protein
MPSLGCSHVGVSAESSPQDPVFPLSHPYTPPPAAPLMQFKTVLSPLKGEPSHTCRETPQVSRDPLIPNPWRKRLGKQINMTKLNKSLVNLSLGAASRTSLSVARHQSPSTICPQSPLNKHRKKFLHRVETCIRHAQ